MNRKFALLVAALVVACGGNWALGADKVEKPKHEKVAKAEKPSPIKEQAYNAETKVLTLTFVNGDVYEYAAVPKETADSLAASEHKGHFFHKEIKGKFAAKKVAPAPK